ncbi:lytic transglycosylase [Gallibacterium anatis]|uniref:Lytic transglycosylase n=1 Tax=Gallibacterium anatis TaxID=750 RepID=A0A1A7P1W9_9PAST|nr:lytic transglycosylase [Gallibacterium anatis]OBW95825.1 lytic transglycosylase [Gallibacterium anatis]OBW98256.1 lytic transglycosylase [Gallibacterium anatis]
MVYKILFSVGLASSMFVGKALAYPIPGIFHQVAEHHQVPSSLLYAIALNETGQKFTNKQIKQPYPYAINVSGKSYFYPSQTKACEALREFMSRYQLKNIDVGIAQVNLGWNGVRYFRSACDGFNVTSNLVAAAQILRDCYLERGNWLVASGCYHHPKGGYVAARYINNVKKHLSLISRSAVGNTSTKIMTAKTENWTAPPPIATWKPESESESESSNFQWILPSTTIVNTATSVTTAFIWVEPESH